MAQLGLIPRSNILQSWDVGDMSIEFGNIIKFRYTPVTKEFLSYWDPTPLIFYLGGNNSDILGMNLHFIPLKYRRELLDIILQIRIKIGASASKIQEITKNRPNLVNVQLDQVLFGTANNIQRTLTGKKGVDWTAFTTLSSNPTVRLMKLGLRVYKVSNIKSIEKLDYVEGNAKSLSLDQLTVNKTILSDTSDIIGLKNSYLANAAKIAIDNGKWYSYLYSKSK